MLSVSVGGGGQADAHGEEGELAGEEDTVSLQVQRVPHLQVNHLQEVVRGGHRTLTSVRDPWS